jgi:hypothetical protein
MESMHDGPCSAHPELMRSMGTIEGTVSAIKETQTKMSGDIRILGVGIEKLKDKVNKQYLIFSGVTGLAGGAVGYFVKHFIVG